MKNTKRIVMSILVVAIVVSAVVWYRAYATGPNSLILTPNEDVQDTGFQNGAEEEVVTDIMFGEKYLSIKGKVTSVNLMENNSSVVALDEEGNEVENTLSNRYLVFVETDNGGTVSFIVTSESIYPKEAEITEGAMVTGFYDANRPVALIYPPQYQAELMAVGIDEAESVFVGRFDENLVSADGQLKLNISNETEIIYEDGAPFNEDMSVEEKSAALANMKLIVVYTVSTRSIPAQTTPQKIIVPYSNIIMPLIDAEIEETDIGDLLFDIASYPIIVEDKELSGSSAYIKNNIVMIPLRAVSEALGYEVSWNDSTKQILVGEAATLTIGDDSYQLGAAPEIKDNKTYVPISFFRNVMSINNAYVFEGQISINNHEQMN